MNDCIGSVFQLSNVFVSNPFTRSDAASKCRGGRLRYRKDEIADEDLCRREGQWATRVERLHNVEFMMSSGFMILSVNVSPMSGAWTPFGVPLHGDSWFNNGSTMAVQVAPRSHIPWRQAPTRQVPDVLEPRTAQHYKES
jgi:hypothetical protein